MPRLHGRFYRAAPKPEQLGKKKRFWLSVLTYVDERVNYPLPKDPRDEQ